MGMTTIGLDDEHRTDFEMRNIFVEAFELVVPFMNPDGNWISKFDEVQAYDVVSLRFPEITGVRLFAVLSSVASVRASERTPVD